MKHQLTLAITETYQLKGGLLHLVLRDHHGERLPSMAPGQFVEVAVDKAKVLLNRPFSIFNFTPYKLELLVKPLGRASEALASYAVGDTLRVIAPLGKGFEMAATGSKVLLVGGGVGVAPLLYLASQYSKSGIRPTLLYGERTAPDATLLARLKEVADVEVCTDDGSQGLHGLVTAHPVLKQDFDMVHVCGPMPMMKAMHRLCIGRGFKAQFSLENKMACGLGACLCCVEDTTTGNRCVCTDGPVFYKEELSW